MQFDWLFPDFSGLVTIMLFGILLIAGLFSIGIIRGLFGTVIGVVLIGLAGAILLGYVEVPIT